MHATPAEINRVLALLEETPRRIAALTSELDHARLHGRPADDAWSVNDILAHLRACADVWGKSILAMLAHDHPTLRYVSPRTWIRKTNYPEQEFQVSFLAFAQQRSDLVSRLRSLTIESWSRTATFTGTVSGREQTVFSYARRIVEHEGQHLEQLESALIDQ